MASNESRVWEHWRKLPNGTWLSSLGNTSRFDPLMPKLDDSQLPLYLRTGDK